MTDLSTTNLEQLLDQATPGPWERHPDNARMLCNLERKFAVHAELAKGNGSEPEPEDVANTEIIALTTDIARELIRIRKELINLREDALYVSGLYPKDLEIQQVFEALETTINHILGDYRD